MNPVSTAAILGSSLFMVILGMPPVTKRLIAFALGENEILEFAAFTPENLKGGAISLAIGAMVYLFVVRRLLFREGSYVNLWPEKLDLEEGLYRPALTKWIPGILLAAASVFGEDKILTPVCTFGFKLLQKTAYCFSVSTDYLILEMRHTVLREKKVRILRNFTFALLMTCLGILMILGVLMIAIVHISQ